MTLLSREEQERRRKNIESALVKYGPPPEDTDDEYYTRLWAKGSNVEDLNKTIEIMSGLVRDSANGLLHPRYGVVSLILRDTPVFLYNHPALKKLCRTAFTDGVHCFIDEEFYEKLMDEEFDSKGTKQGVIPLILHELMHKMFDHTNRLRAFGPEIANIATDISINTNLQQGFPDIKWCKLLTETGWGFNPGDIDKYAKLSEETIAQLIYQDRKKNTAKNQQGAEGKQDGESNRGSRLNQRGSSGNSGDGFEGEDESDNGKSRKNENDPEGNDGGNEQDNTPGDTFGGEDDNHLITLKDLAEALEEAGLEEVMDLLNLPSSSNQEGLDEMLNENKNRQKQSMQRAAIDAANAQRNGGTYPGAHIAECAGEYIKAFGKGKLSWKLGLRDAILGHGKRTKNSYDELASICYVSSVTKMLGNRLFLPSKLRVKNNETVVVILDTSGSVSSEDINMFLNECFELKTASENMGDAASKILIYSADTIVRGDPIEITDQNVDEFMHKGINVYGRGGTDLGESIKTVLNSERFKEHKISSIVFFTDLYDTAPTPESCGLKDYDGDLNVTFIGAASTHSSYFHEWKKQVENWARVVHLKDGEEVDLSEEVTPQNSNITTKRRRKTM